MNSLENSTRTFLQATYTPAATESDDAPEEIKPRQRPWEKMFTLNTLAASDSELDAVQNEHPNDEALINAVALLLEQSPEQDSLDLAFIQQIGEVPVETIEKIASSVLEMRKRLVTEMGERVEQLGALWQEHQHSEVHVISDTSVDSDADTSEVPELVEFGTPVLADLLVWGGQNTDGAALEVATFIDGNLQRFGIDAQSDAHISAVTQFSQVAVDGPQAALNAFIAAMEVEPVGFLHLEKLNFTPAEIERGELVYSVPLAPGEEVNITHKEWSHNSEEFERFVTDFIEEYSEEGVAEKMELAQAVANQEKHSTGFNTGVTASGGYGPVSVTASVAFKSNTSSTRSSKLSRKRSQEIAQKATSRVKREHKTSFKVSSASGTSEEAVRKLKNPSDTKATRVDYYQLIRKWRVDLLRYGVRMTYDLNIPEPGLALLQKIMQIRYIDRYLAKPFGFALKPADINDKNWHQHAADYNAAGVPAPPKETMVLSQQMTHRWTKDEAKADYWGAIEFDVDQNYEVDSFTPYLYPTPFPDHLDLPDKFISDIATDLSWIKGHSGKIQIVYRMKWLENARAVVQLQLKRRETAYREWQLAAWQAIRDSSESAYNAQRRQLQAYREVLEDEIGSQDPLTLRKIEREEVMKNVLRWMIGPSFDFLRYGLPASTHDLYQADASVKTVSWKRTLAYGELIRFLHQAVEWENMIYFLYPYFWTDPGRWQDKLDIDHPDFLHKVFLKAGSARVVLPIRPGFEREFSQLIELGDFGAHSGDHPYLTIAEEMQNFANTNYPNTPSANPATNVRPLLTPRQQKAWADIEMLMGLLEQYKEQHKTYPNTQQGLAALQPFAPSGVDLSQLEDPWQNAYSYQSPGEYADYDLASFGKNGVSGIANDAEDADITSWAEASVVGRWYEHTPTSALDIAIDEKLPTA